MLFLKNTCAYTQYTHTEPSYVRMGYISENIVLFNIQITTKQTLIKDGHFLCLFI